MKKTALKRKTGLKRKKPMRRMNWSRAKVKSRYDLKDGHFHASKGEEHCDTILHQLQEAGEISDLVRQPKVTLIPDNGKVRGIFWRVDWQWTEDGATVYADHKGNRPLDGREQLMIRLWRHMGPGPLQLLAATKRGYKVTKVITGLGGTIQ